VTPDDFREQLLQQMERKTHWAWPAFTQGLVPAERLHVHLEQEYEVYVRDFPVLVGRAYVQCPVPVVRRELAENIYEEETGGLQAGRPHPELFLEYPRGLGMDLSRFEHIELLPRAAEFRSFLDRATTGRGWAIATVITTIFLEGTAHDRSVLDPNAPKRPEPPLEEHPLVAHYGLPLDRLELTKAHRAVEGEHRASAWQVMVEHIPAEDHEACVSWLTEAVDRWKAYRDEVAEHCGIVAGPDGSPQRTG
jgi:pyrroloquinoline-quinone synthase